MKKLVILADFPLHVLPGHKWAQCKGHFATWLPQLAKEFENMDHYEVHWVIVTPLFIKKNKVCAWGQTFHLLPRWKLSVSMLTGYLAERRRIKKLLCQLSPNILHAWGSEGVYGLALVDWGKDAGILSMQGILTRCCSVAKMPWLMRVQSLWERLVLSRAKLVTCESDWGIKMCKKISDGAVFEKVEYGVRDIFFNVKRLPTNSKLVIYVGSVNMLKGSDVLLSAFSDPRLSDIELKILGSSASGAGIINYPSNVEFMGRLPTDDVVKWMSKAWALIHPTRADTSPNCVKEARVIGLPVVTTYEGGQVQYVDHKRSGWLYDPENMEGLIEGVLMVTTSKTVSLEMGSYNNLKCRDELSTARTVEQFLELYNQF